MGNKNWSLFKTLFLVALVAISLGTFANEKPPSYLSSLCSRVLGKRFEKLPSPKTPKGSEVSEVFVLKTFKELSPHVSESIFQGIFKLAHDLYVEAEENGWEGIFPISEQTMAHVYSQDIDTGYSLIVLNDQSEVVAFGLSYFDEERGVIVLNKLAVMEAYQGRGLSKKIMTHLANRALEDKVPYIVLRVRKGNTQAINIYRRFGFWNTTPYQYRFNSRFSSYHFKVAANVLFERTR